MYLSELTIENFRCFGEGDNKFRMSLNPGLTALVGENDSGKTAVIDALRFALGTKDQERLYLDDSDFNVSASSHAIRIVCKFSDLSDEDKRAFIEYLTYETNGANSNQDVVLYLNWTASDTGKTLRGRPYRRIEVRSGKDGNGPQFDQQARELLRATYLRPLRDAEQALSAGRGSRLAQILQHSDEIHKGKDRYDGTQPLDVSNHNLNVLGIVRLIDELLKNQNGIVAARKEINDKIENLVLRNSDIASIIKISDEGIPDDQRIRKMLEKLDLVIKGDGKPGLGSNNVLFMACELLLLGKDEGNRLLLIEEPEAHLHPQRQLRAMKFLQEQAEKSKVQIIITTHSPNLASVIKLDNIVMIRNRKAFSMAKGKTLLNKSDYQFLERFLDVTKANLFFARGVMIVEGAAENILLPVLARLIGRDFAEYGISIVNVGGRGLSRYAKIFQRANVNSEGVIDIPVACVTDLDVMPDCAPKILGLVSGDDDKKWNKKESRHWRAKRDFNNDDLDKRRTELETKISGQNVRAFVADEWTLEYALALGPKDSNGDFSGALAEDVFVAAFLAKHDDKLNSGEKQFDDVEEKSLQEFRKLDSSPRDGCTDKEVIAAHVYAKFTGGGVSKAIAAQYLAKRLQQQIDEHKITPEQLRESLPTYLVQAIEYVIASSKADDSEQEDAPDE